MSQDQAFAMVELRVLRKYASASEDWWNEVDAARKEKRAANPVTISWMKEMRRQLSEVWQGRDEWEGIAEREAE